jgi:Zn-dependent alcohol dehydrogenase
MYGSADPERDFPMLAALYAEGNLDLDALVSSTRPFTEINEGIAETREGGPGRVVLTF